MLKTSTTDKFSSPEIFNEISAITFFSEKAVPTTSAEIFGKFLNTSAKRPTSLVLIAILTQFA